MRVVDRVMEPEREGHFRRMGRMVSNLRPALEAFIEVLNRVVMALRLAIPVQHRYPQFLQPNGAANAQRGPRT